MDYSSAKFQRDCKRISEVLEAGSAEASGMTSLFEGSETSETSDDSVDLDEFDLDGFTKEEVNNYNSIAEYGQRLQDAVTPTKMRQLMQDASSKSCILLIGRMTSRLMQSRSDSQGIRFFDNSKNTLHPEAGSHVCPQASLPRAGDGPFHKIGAKEV